MNSLRDTDGRVRHDFVLGSIGMVITSSTRDIVDVNDETCEMLGYERDELLHKTWAQLTHREDLPDLAQFNRVMTGELDGYSAEQRFIRKNGQVLYSTVSVKCMRANALAGYSVVLLQDVGERKCAERVLSGSEERLRTVAESSPIMIWTTNADGRIEFMNNAGLAFFNKCPDDTVDIDWRTVLHPEDLAKYVTAFQSSLIAQKLFHIRARARRHDGQWRWLELRAVPQMDSSGRVTGYVGCSPDITEIFETKQALREAARRKDEFLATLAHELRSPLAPLRNGLQIMKLTRGNDQALEEARSMMERQLRMLVSLVEDLLDLSRINRGQIAIHKQCVDITAVVNSALETSEPLLRQCNHELTVLFPPWQIHVYADKIRLAQAISNLLSNAAKYTNPGGRVSLSVVQDGSDVCIKVKDTGVGIHPSMLSRVFDMFTQVDSSIEHAQGGLGIGLTLVKRLVEMHDGTVEACSAGHDQGSEFIIRLPMAPAAVEEGDPHQQNTASAPAPACHRILVVDDNREAALSLALMLNLMGNDTRTAFDGIEALNLAQKFQPDVMLMDIGMPKLNGYDTARRIREQTWGKRTVLVAVTGWGQEVDRRCARDSGFDHHLVKPVEPEALQSLLASLHCETMA